MSSIKCIRGSKHTHPNTHAHTHTLLPQGTHGKSRRVSDGALLLPQPVMIAPSVGELVKVMEEVGVLRPFAWDALTPWPFSFSPCPPCGHAELLQSLAGKAQNIQGMGATLWGLCSG